MNLNQLEYFISLAETLNFTKAAEKCFISQTAMTQQIRALETAVGVTLFERDRHHVELTAAGRVYLAEARKIVSRSDEAIRLARLVSEGVSGELTIGFASGYGSGDLQDKLRQFHQAFSGIGLHLVSGNSSILFEELTAGRCDIILTVSPKIRNHPELISRRLSSYPVMAALPSDHPLAGRPSLTYRELENESFIMMEPTGRPKDQMEECIIIYEKGGYYPTIVGMEGKIENLMLEIAIGMGISILPEYIVRPYLRDPSFKILPMVREDGDAETVDFEADWRRDASNPALLQFLRTAGLIES